MKTKMNIRKVAKTSLTALALFFMSTTLPMQANDTNEAVTGKNKNQEAYSNLEKLIAKMESAVKFEAASVTDDRNTYEAIIAEESMDNLTSVMEQTIRYIAPGVNEGAEEYELALAYDRLDNLTTNIEQSLKYSVPEENDSALALLARENAMFFRFERPVDHRITMAR